MKLRNRGRLQAPSAEAPEDEMAGWHHRYMDVRGHEFGQTPGDGEGQGGLACCRPWGRKEWKSVGD